MKKYECTITFTEDVLGTVPLDKDIYSSYVAAKAMTEGVEKEKIDEELSTVAIDEKGTTGFHTDKKGNPLLYDYMIKGFLKEACGMLRQVTGSAAKGFTSYKKKIDGLLFVFPRAIPIKLKGKMGTLERPLRASTPKGERVALAKSETAPAGSVIKFEIQVLGGISLKLLKELLDYGKLKGIGQWRNGSYGRFSYKLKALKK